MDEPLVWFSGSGTSAPRWLHADHQGSIVAASDASGVLVGAPFTYGPYGEPDPVNAWLGSRFRYTGQIALPDAQLYHYKARAYDPALGRFLQTDPVGYSASLSVYGYVSNDPLNMIDPLGLQATDPRASGTRCGHGIIICAPPASHPSFDENDGNDLFGTREMQRQWNDFWGTEETRSEAVNATIQDAQVQLGPLEDALNSPEGVLLGIILDPSPAGEINAGRRAIQVIDGFVDAAGSAFKFRPQYYERLWRTGRPAPFVSAQEVLETATSVTPDRMPGFYRYSNGVTEMVYNTATREVWHLQPIRGRVP